MNAVAQGARTTGATVDVKRVPETVPEEVAKAAYSKLDQEAPVATVAELADYDAMVVGTPTRFGRMSIPDGSISGSGRRSVDELRAEWQSW